MRVLDTGTISDGHPIPRHRRKLRLHHHQPAARRHHTRLGPLGLGARFGGRARLHLGDGRSRADLVAPLRRLRKGILGRHAGRSEGADQHGTRLQEDSRPRPCGSTVPTRIFPLSIRRRRACCPCASCTSIPRTGASPGAGRGAWIRRPTSPLHRARMPSSRCLVASWRNPTSNGRNMTMQVPAGPRRGCASPGTAGAPGRSSPPWPVIRTTRWPTGTSGRPSIPMTAVSSPRSGPTISWQGRTSISISPSEPRMDGRGRSRGAPAFPASTASLCPWAETGCWPPIRGAGTRPGSCCPSVKISG